MTVRVWILAVLLAVSGACFVVAASHVAEAVGWLVAGLVIAAYGAVVVRET